MKTPQQLMDKIVWLKNQMSEYKASGELHEFMDDQYDELNRLLYDMQWFILGTQGTQGTQEVA